MANLLRAAGKRLCVSLKRMLFGRRAASSVLLSKAVLTFAMSKTAMSSCRVHYPLEGGENAVYPNL